MFCELLKLILCVKYGEGSGRVKLAYGCHLFRDVVKFVFRRQQIKRLAVRVEVCILYPLLQDVLDAHFSSPSRKPFFVYSNYTFT